MRRIGEREREEPTCCVTALSAVKQGGKLGRSLVREKGGAIACSNFF